jgi:ArsR family transcriptional regulator
MLLTSIGSSAALSLRAVDGRVESQGSRLLRAIWPYVIEQLQSYVPPMQMTEDMIEEAARRFALLGDPTRLRILQTVMERGEMSVGAIAEVAGASRFNTSAHLNRLALGGLVARRRDGSTVYYRVDDKNLPRICDWMCQSLQLRAKALATRL